MHSQMYRVGMASFRTRSTMMTQFSSRIGFTELRIVGSMYCSHETTGFKTHFWA